MLGRDVLAMLEERKFPVMSLLLFGSGDMEVGEVLQFQGTARKVEQIDPASIDGLDAVIFAGGPHTSRQYAGRLGLGHCQ